MSTSRIEITATDSPIGQVLDQYYTFLKRLIGGDQGRVFLLNTITPFDLYPETPLYNENMWANYADMVIGGRSPLVVDESQGISLRSKFSTYYADIVRLASAKIERKSLSAEDRTRIADIENDIDRKREKMDGLDTRLAEGWDKHAAALHLTPNTIEYDFEKINYYTNSGIASQIASIAEEILDFIAQIEDIKMAAVPADHRVLIRLNYIVRAKEFRMFRPFRARTEKELHLDHLALVKLLATARSTIGLRDIVEEHQQILPFNDLSVMFKAGERSLTISKQHGELDVHDTDWSASASGRHFFVCKASASASYKSHVESAMKASESIGISFKQINEIRVDRRDWYDTSIFGLDTVKQVVESNKEFARNTRYVVTSLIIGRGLSTTFKFSQSEHYQTMSDFKSSASGGISLGFASFGSSGEYHRYDFHQSDSSAEKTVTFADGDDLCRVLALRYDQVHTIGDAQETEDAFHYAADNTEAALVRAQKPK